MLDFLDRDPSIVLKFFPSLLFLGGLIDGREEEGRGRFFNISFFFSPLFHLSLLISLSRRV